MGSKEVFFFYWQGGQKVKCVKNVQNNNYFCSRLFSFFVLLYLSSLLLIGNEFESSEFWLLTCELKLKTTAFAPLNLLLNKTNRYFTYKDSDLNSCKFYKYQIIFWKKLYKRKKGGQKIKHDPQEERAMALDMCNLCFEYHHFDKNGRRRD